MSSHNNFLNDLLGNGRYKYKRYNGLPLRYAGGKSLAVGHVVENMPGRVRKLVSPFFGGGSVEIACSKELGLEVIGYDVFSILVNYWQIQLSDGKKLAQRLRGWKPTKDKYNKVKQRLKKHWTGERLIEDAVSLAAHYWFNHNLSYGPGFLGWMSSIYQDEMRYKRLLDKVSKFECPKLSVKRGTFEDTFKKHKKAFMYCDPPYYLNGDSKMFRGIYPQRNFPIHHNGFDHEKLRELLYTHRGGFVLSYNDCEVIREWYSDFEIKEVRWQYTLGQGEVRIGKNRVNNGTDHIKHSHELLIIGK